MTDPLVALAVQAFDQYMTLQNEADAAKEHWLGVLRGFRRSAQWDEFHSIVDKRTQRWNDEVGSELVRGEVPASRSSSGAS